MSDTTHVAVLVGSLRADSVNRKVAEYLRDHAPEGVTLDVVEGIDALPFYNEDIDTGSAPEAAERVRDAVAQADGLLLVTPEYNGTMPAVLNNALDWLSRPFGTGAIQGKPFAAIGATPTPYGGKWSHDDARRSAGVAGARVLEEIVVSQPAAEGDVLADDEVVARLLSALESLVRAEDRQAA